MSDWSAIGRILMSDEPQKAEVCPHSHWHQGCPYCWAQHNSFVPQAELNAAVEVAREECVQSVLQLVANFPFSPQAIAGHVDTFAKSLAGDMARDIRSRPSTGALDRLIAGAYLACVQAIRRFDRPSGCKDELQVALDTVAERISTLTPADAQAALDRALNEARHKLLLAIGNWQEGCPCGCPWCNDLRAVYEAGKAELEAAVKE